MGFTIYTLAALISSWGLAEAISLSDFTPATTGLTPSCQQVYTAGIPGCTSTDFKKAQSCSSACLDGLVRITAQVDDACAADTPPSNSLVGIFLQGKGIRALCNIEVVTKTTGPAAPTKTPLAPVPRSSSETSTLPPASIDPSLPPTAPVAISIGTESSSPPMSTMTLTQNTPSKPTSNGMATVSTPTFTSSAVATAEPAKLPKCSAGGGSPFDNAPGQSCESSGSTLSLSYTLLTAALFAILLSQASLH